MTALTNSPADRRPDHRRPEHRRDELIAAASAVFFAKGYRATSVADIVAETSAGHGTFYNYFDSRRDILDAVIEYQFARLLDVVLNDDVVPNNNESDVLRGATTLEEFGAAVEETARRFLRVTDANPGLARFVLYDAPAIDHGVVTKLAGLFDRVAALIATSVRNGVDRGYLRADLDVTIGAETVAALVAATAVSALGPVSVSTAGSDLGEFVMRAFGA